MLGKRHFSTRWLALGTLAILCACGRLHYGDLDTDGGLDAPMDAGRGVDAPSADAVEAAPDAPLDAALDVGRDAGCSPACAAGNRCVDGTCEPCAATDACGPSCEPCAGSTPVCAGTALGCVCDDTSCGAREYCDFGTCAPCGGTGPCRLSASTNFTGLMTGVSVDGQDGWASRGSSYDEEVVDDGTGNLVWRVSNAVTSGNFYDLPYTPCPAGVPMPDARTFAPTMPDFFAGETSHMVTYDRYVTRIRFRSATGAHQPGLAVSMSIDSGAGGRMTYIQFEDRPGGIAVRYSSTGASTADFVTNLSFTSWHTLTMEISYRDGSGDDLVRYEVDGVPTTVQSWEVYYAGTGEGSMPVQCALFRLSGAAAPSVAGGGYLFDDYLGRLETQ